MVLTDTGLAKVFQRIKSFIASQLNSKASAIHTHTKSEITDFPTNYVTTDTTQTIGGLKSFYDVGRYYIDLETKSTNLLNFKVLNIELDNETNLPTKNYTFSQNITSTNPALYLGNYYSLTLQGLVGTDIRNYKYGSNKDWAGIAIRYTLNDETYITVKSNRFIPVENNTTNLGSPSLQWNNTYTRNILIDNDINIASSLINKTSNSGVLTVRGGINDTEGASLSLYGKDYGGSPGLIGNIYMTAYGNSDYTNFRIYPNGIIRVYNNSTATTKNVAMQEDVVNLTGAQTIAGNKTFSGTIEFTSSPGVKRTSDPFYHLTTTGYNKGTNPSSNLYSGIRFFSNPNDTAQNKITGGLDMVYYASGYNAIGLNVRNYDENSNHRFFTVALRVSNDSTIPVDFVPSVNALINLGSSTTYWKDCYTKAINGVNPGALSLPSTATGYVDIKSTVGQYLKDNNTNIYEFTAPFDGWVSVGIIKGSLRVDNVTTSISSGSEVLGYWCSYTIPFRKDDVIQIKINKMDPADDYVNDIMWKAYIYPCQGNV